MFTDKRRTTLGVAQRIGLAMFLVAAGPVALEAALGTWSNGSGGQWETAGNWSPAVSPGPTTDAEIYSPAGTYTVNINNLTADTGSTATWMRVVDFLVEGTGGPTLLVDYTNGTKFVVSGAASYLGFNGGKTGRLTLNNGFMDLQSHGLNVGQGGTGILTVNGGTFQSVGALAVGAAVASSVTQTGGTIHVGSVGVSVGSTILVTGGSFASDASITVLNGSFTMNGGTVSAVGNDLIGSGAGVTGTFTVTGGTNTANNLMLANTVGGTGVLNVSGGSARFNDYNVGNHGTATVNLSGGEIVQPTTAHPSQYFGVFSDGTLTWNQSAGLLRIRDPQMIMGYQGTAFWNLSGGSNQIDGKLTVGDNLTTASGSITVTGGRLRTDLGLELGNSGVGSLVVSNGQVSSGGSITFGSATGGRGSMSVFGGTVDAGSTVNIGKSASSTGSVLVSDSGILQANTYSLGTAATGGYGTLTNRTGGTLRFTADSPSITKLNANAIFAVTNAAVEFKDVANANLTGDLATKVTYSGANALRLNNSTNASPGTMTFATGQNFATLALVNGNTRWNSSFLITGSGGAVLLSNTQASFSGAYTNQGTFSSYHSSATFEGNVVNSGAWITDPSTNTFNGDYSLTSTGYVQMAAGDVYTFKSNFVNQSTQSNAYDTVAGKFLFNGTSVTQTFFTAGKDLGPEAGYTPGRTNNILPGTVFGTGPGASNFALGTLEISNSSTVKVSDAFSLTLGNDDSQRAALYLDQLILDQNSWLIIDTNVTVYFRGSNDWAAAGAGVSMLFDGELHQLVPEPSILLLWAGGLGVLGWLRRRSMRK